jgi:hypothetical protein
VIALAVSLCPQANDPPTDPRHQNGPFSLAPAEAS